MGLDWVLRLIVGMGVCGSSVVGQSGLSAPAAPENLSVKNEVEHAITKGLTWLVSNQSEQGSWSTSEHPALTALAVIALQGNPKKGTSSHQSNALREAYPFLLNCVKPDGGIYGKELATYNTSLSLVALVAANNPNYRPVMLKARQFLIQLQADFDAPGQADNVFDGGIGYGSKYQHSDMSNTLMALEALYHSRKLGEENQLAGAKELNWDAVIHFIQNCQNLPSHNQQAWVSGDPENKGGFIYFPGNSMAGETNTVSGQKALRSYGSISYAGLLSYIYADLKRDDPRVSAVFEWLRDHYTLEENPGMGLQGLYYYYHTMAKGLSVYGVDELEMRDGRRVNWRKELALALINRQRADGSWANENGRWWEKDPALVTAYAVIALEYVHRGM